MSTSGVSVVPSCEHNYVDEGHSALKRERGSTNFSLVDMPDAARLSCMTAIQSGFELRSNTLSACQLHHRRCLLHRSTLDGSDNGAVHLGDVLLHSLKEASCAPLELAAAAFAGLGSVLAQDNVGLITLMCASTHNASCTESCELGCACPSHEQTKLPRIRCTGVTRISTLVARPNQRGGYGQSHASPWLAAARERDVSQRGWARAGQHWHMHAGRPAHKPQVSRPKCRSSLMAVLLRKHLISYILAGAWVQTLHS